MPEMVILNGPVIQAGESLSDAIDCSAGRLVRITSPAGWTGNAPLTFLISTDGQGFSDLYLANGDEVTIVCGASRGILVRQDDWLPGLHLKFRSGTAAHPIAQAERREFAVALLVEPELVYGEVLSTLEPERESPQEPRRGR